MKKLKLGSLLAVLVLILGIQQTAYAQVDFGLRGGVNFANYSDVDGDLDSRSGLMIGAYLDIGVPMAPISIQPEVTYSQKGAEFGGSETNVDYLEVPVLAKFSFAPGPASPHIYAGPYAGFVINSESNGVDVSDNTETDFGGIVGAGLDINAAVIKFNVGARYGFGLVDAFSSGSGKNSVFSVVAGISF